MRITGFFPFLALVLITAKSWPSALAPLLVYFIIGGGMSAFWNWAFRKSQKASDIELLPAAMWLSFYVWPLALIMIYKEALKQKAT